MLKKYSWIGENKLVNWCHKQDKNWESACNLQMIYGMYLKCNSCYLRYDKNVEKNIQELVGNELLIGLLCSIR